MIVADLTGPNSATDITEGSLNFTVNAEGSASFTKLQSFTVAQGADSGSDGDTGAPAKNISVSVNWLKSKFFHSVDKSSKAKRACWFDTAVSYTHLTLPTNREV